MLKKNGFYRRRSKTMAGTEGTNEYKVLLDTALGGVGMRTLPGDRVRIRVEPTSQEAADKIAAFLNRSRGWKQPGDGGQMRCSIVVSAMIMGHYVDRAAIALIQDGHVPVVRRTSPTWLKRHFTRKGLMIHARLLGFRGVNSRWSKSLLCARMAAHADAAGLA